MQHSPDPELSLLQSEESFSSDINASDHSIRTAPILTGDASANLGPDIIPQRAVYGRIITQVIDGEEHNVDVPKLYVNTNAPFSAVVCGLQGSGKSHSTSVLMESCLIRDSRIGTLPAPLSTVLFHFDSAAGGGQAQPCEAAFLSSLDPHRGGTAMPPEVIVLALPSNINTMRKVYAPLPNVKVEPLRFSAKDISGERLLAMMKVEDNTQMPLYMELIMTILRDMSDDFDYLAFRDTLTKQKLDGQQKAMLSLRLALLDSCLKGGSETNTVSAHFKQGQLTIIDLSSPFMDASSACGFFDIILGLFLEAKVETGKLIVLDEAHKYLSEAGSSSRLTDSLLATIRQQRHLNTRVVISTQEPTVIPSKFLELSSFMIIHRFSSPQWLRHVSAHVSAAQDKQEELFSKVVGLQTGQAIIFAPSGLGVKTISGALNVSRNPTSCASTLVTPFGQGYVVVRSRQRITFDGGQSLLAVQNISKASQSNLDEVSASSGLYATPGMALKSDTAWSSSSTNVENGQGDGAIPTSMKMGPAVSDEEVWYGMRDPGFVEYDWGAGVARTPSPVAVRPDNGLSHFIPLVHVLSQAQEEGHSSISWSVCDRVMTRHSPPPVYPNGLLAVYLQDAKRAKVVDICIKNNSKDNSVKLLHPDLASVPRQTVEEEFAPLLFALRELQSAGRVRADWSETANKVKGRDATAYTKGTFVYYVEAAVKAGVVESGKDGHNRWIRSLVG